MGRLLDRTPIVVMVLVGCAMGALLAGTEILTSSNPAMAALWPAASQVVLWIVAIGFALVLLVSWLRGLYWVAFEQPGHNLPGRPMGLQFLLGLGYVAATTLALDVIEQLIASRSATRSRKLTPRWPPLM